MKTKMVVGRLKGTGEIGGYAFLDLQDELDAIVSLKLLLPAGLWVTAEVEQTPKGLRTRRVLMVAYDRKADTDAGVPESNGGVLGDGEQGDEQR